MIEGFGESEGVSMGTDLEISSTIETGASSADDDENVPFAFDMSNRVSYIICYVNLISGHSIVTHEFLSLRLNYHAVFVILNRIWSKLITFHY